MNTLSKNKVVLGLSGGVDSATAALLLKQQGFTVIGFYFDVLGTNQQGVAAAKALAEYMDIDFVSMDVSEEFEAKVIENFCTEYCSGRTPNPCTLCNPEIKFKKLIEVADRYGAYYIATGHYARIFHKQEQDAYYIRKGANQKKDQSYMLYRLTQETLSRLIFPLGEIEEKAQTREISRKFHLPNAEASDSQEICFIDEEKDNYITYLQKRGYSTAEGNFVNASGEILGRHQGILHYTIGQRKGLGIALGKPAFVTEIDAKENRVVLGDNSDLFKTEVYSESNVFSTPQTLRRLKEEGRISVAAKIRYAAKPAEATIEELSDGRVLTRFTAPQRAVTPGQSVVFYEGECVIGGGIISSEQC